MNKTTLYHKTSKGEVQVWNIHTNCNYIISEYGRHMGKMQTATKTAKGKNIGKSNETSPEEQAILQMISMIAKKRDKNYHDTIEQAMNAKPILPMLAKNWFDHGHKFDCSVIYVQKKFNGNRCLAEWDGENIILRSRGNKTYNIPHIAEQMKTICIKLNIPTGTIFDGEIYEHGKSLQQINSAVKKLRDSTYTLNYHIYDVADELQPFKNRNLYITHVIDSNTLPIPQPNIKLVESYEVPNDKFLPELLKKLHDAWVNAGYEGLILRHSELPYKLGYRSDQLLKYKMFDDSEFKVVGFTNGEGSFDDQVVFICEMDDGSGRTFKATPRGTREIRRAYLSNGNKYIGEMLTVIYFGRTDGDIPNLPVGKCFRMKEDLE